MSDDEDFSFLETDANPRKIDFDTVLMVQLMKINELLSSINTTPPELYKIGASMSLNDVKPNRVNFINAITALEITICPYCTKERVAQLKIIDERETDDNGKELSDVKRAQMKWKVLMFALKDKMMLPIESLE